MLEKFQEFRKLGIYKVNQNQAGIENPVFQREEKNQKLKIKNLSVVTNVKGFTAENSFISTNKTVLKNQQLCHQQYRLE